MKKILISALMISIITVSCKKEEEVSEAPQTNEVESGVFLESLNSSNTTDPSTTSTQDAINPTSTQSTKPGMNPPHGQPGHRCEIAVGAPLNSSPTTPLNNAKTTTTTNTTPPKVVPASPAISPVSNATAPGMNPEHGQPGHICEIPVGAPLSQAK